MSDQAYVGPAMWISIKHRFGPRMTEWFLAGHTALWGFVLAKNDDIFEQPAWSGFRDLIGDSATILGWTMMMLGLLCGLWPVSRRDGGGRIDGRYGSAVRARFDRL